MRGELNRAGPCVCSRTPTSTLTGRTYLGLLRQSVHYKTVRDETSLTIVQCLYCHETRTSSKPKRYLTSVRTLCSRIMIDTDVASGLLSLSDWDYAVCVYY